MTTLIEVCRTVLIAAVKCSSQSGEPLGLKLCEVRHLKRRTLSPLWSKDPAMRCWRDTEPVAGLLVLGPGLKKARREISTRPTRPACLTLAETKCRSLTFHTPPFLPPRTRHDVHSRGGVARGRREENFSRGKERTHAKGRQTAHVPH